MRERSFLSSGGSHVEYFVNWHGLAAERGQGKTIDKDVFWCSGDDE